jgi:hypothetical protein
MSVLGQIPSNNDVRQKLKKEMELSLGGGMIDLEADPAHYDLAIDRAFDRYRTRSKNATEESFIFLEVQPETQAYTLPNEVLEVRDVYRRGASGNTAGGTFFDPFSAAVTNSVYGIPYASGTSGNLATYDAALQYQELVGRMFGLEIMYTWNKVTKKLSFHRKFAAPEQVLLWVYNYRPESVLLSSYDSRQWLRDYSVAALKMYIGEARSFFSSIPGPGGGTTLNGDALKSDAQAEMQRLEEEISVQKDGGDEGYWFVIG